jgi:hypothetical protein
VKTPPDRFRDEALSKALDDAIAGNRAPFYDKMRRGSGLPGPRFNQALVRAFAGEVAKRGGEADALLAALRAFHDENAPFGHVDEFLAILGVAGTGARAASDLKARKQLMEPLMEAARDVRSRVRVEVTTALIAIGQVEGQAFGHTLRMWAEDEDAYVVQAALEAAAHADLMPKLGPEHVGAVLDRAYLRIANETRSGRRSEAFNRLMRALAVLPAAIVARYPQLAELLEKHTKTNDEDVRIALEEVLPAIRKSRAHDRAEALEIALKATKKPSRDPRWDRLPGKRGRGR